MTHSRKAGCRTNRTQRRSTRGIGPFTAASGYTDQEYEQARDAALAKQQQQRTTTKEETAAAMAKVNDALAQLNLDSEDEEEPGGEERTLRFLPLVRAPRMPDPRCVLQSRLNGLPPLATQARMRSNASIFSRHFAHAEKDACRLRIGP